MEKLLRLCHHCCATVIIVSNNRIKHIGSSTDHRGLIESLSQSIKASESAIDTGSSGGKLKPC
jgi:hypothetical protein